MNVHRKIFKIYKQFWYKRDKGIIQINRNKYKMNPEIPKDDHLKFGTLDKKWSFLLRISSVIVTKSVGNCGFGYIYWKNR